MAQLVLASVRKIAQADRLLNDPRFYDVGPLGQIRLLFWIGKVWREYSPADF